MMNQMITRLQAETHLKYGVLYSDIFTELVYVKSIA